MLNVIALVMQPCYCWWEVPYYWLGLKVPRHPPKSIILAWLGLGLSIPAAICSEPERCSCSEIALQAVVLMKLHSCVSPAHDGHLM